MRNVMEAVLVRLLRRTLTERFGEDPSQAGEERQGADRARVAKDADDDNRDQLIYDADMGSLDEADDDAEPGQVRLVYVPRAGYGERKEATAQVVSRSKTTITVKKPNSDERLVLNLATGRSRDAKRGTPSWYSGWMLADVD